MRDVTFIACASKYIYVGQRRSLCSAPVWSQHFVRSTPASSWRPKWLLRFRLRSFHENRFQRQLQVESYPTSHDEWISLLPTTCPGCGAFSQTSQSDRPGCYTTKRGVVKAYIARQRNQKSLEGQPSSEDEISKEEHPSEDRKAGTVESSDNFFSEFSDKPAGKKNEREYTKNPTSKRSTSESKSKKSVHKKSSPEDSIVAEESTDDDFKTPFCDRCHDLIYLSEGVPISHPGIQSIADTIASSPHRRNHVYHVIDAVDFPLSIVPGLFNVLSLVRQRTQNRRAKDPKFKSKDHDATVSFIITRSDLLAPDKGQVDRMMPWFIEHLRDALGSHGEGARMGNVHLVSAKRGWWTPQLKDELKKRGGANWMVGKVNVGKSNLLEVLLPKGMFGHSAEMIANLESDLPDDNYSKSSIPLPPPQPLTPTPTLPLVSALPGTTASPIRLPFVTYAPSIAGRGELVDLPGLERSLLSTHVEHMFHKHLVMVTRPRPTKLTIKPGQSLLIGGGMVRITPIIPKNRGRGLTNTNLELDNSEDDGLADMSIMAYDFLPAGLGTHVTATEKAVSHQLKENKIHDIENVLKAGSASTIRSAGVFELDTNVTRKSAEKVLRAGMKADRLFFKIFSTEILVEGVGWIELAVSVRRGFTATGWPIPKVEIFTPEGKFIGCRRPLEIWSMLEADLPKSIKDRRKHAKSVQSARVRRKKRR
ncbi:MAG: hypothetical protein Q9160_004863 [Pyrenula sp. 1 TL-2023]